MKTERPSRWRRHIRLIASLVTLAAVALVALICLASPRLAAVVAQAGPYHPVFLIIRATLYTVVLMNWARLARHLNPEVRPETIQATRRSVLTLMVVFEVSTALPYLLSRT